MAATATAGTPRTSASRSRRWRSSTSRRSRTARSTPESSSSTTSRRRRKRSARSTVVAVPLVDSAKGPGAGDMFLKVKGAKSGLINGESQDQGKHKNEIEVLAWSWGMQGKPSLGGGAASGKATMRELRITKKVDKASTALMSALRTNELINEATLTLRKVGKTPLEYLVIKIENGRVTTI